MGCFQMEELLSGYVNEELSPEERERVETHISGCAECRQALDEYRNVRRQLETLRLTPVAPDMKPEVMSRIKAFR